MRGSPVRRFASDKARPALGAALLVAAVVVAYIPAMSAGFIWDDDVHVTENKVLPDPDGLWRIWFDPSATIQYYPMVHSTYWIEYRLWGLEPTGYHVVNIALHALNALLLWAALRRIGLPGAWLAAAVWGLHPMQVESVAWVMERKNVLSGFFYLGALNAWLRSEGFGREATGTETKKNDARFYILALLLYLCALLSKTVTVSLPVVVLLVLWWRRGRLVWRDALRAAPFFAVGGVLALRTILLERYQVGAWGPEFDWTPVERCLIAGRALWFYAGKLVWPTPLVFVYPKWEINQLEAWQYLFPLAALAVAAALWFARRRIGRGPIAAVAIYGVTLFPALGFVSVYPMRYSYVADHFQYLAGAGLIALTVALWARLGRRLGRVRSSLGWGHVAASAAVLVALAVPTWRRGHDYKSLESIFLDTVRKNPEGWMAHSNLRGYYDKRGMKEKAEVHLQKVRTLRHVRARRLTEQGREDLEAGRPRRAIEKFRRSVRLDPKYLWSYTEWGRAAESLGREREAIKQYGRATRLKDVGKHVAAKIKAHMALGTIFAARGETEQAISNYVHVLLLAPEHLGARCALGLTLIKAGRVEEAIIQLKAALRVAPDNMIAHYDLGMAYERLGDRQRARAHYTRALEQARALGATPLAADIERALRQIAK